MSRKNVVELLNTKQIAEELGESVTFIQKLIRTGQLKAIKTGKSYRVTRAEINRYLGLESDCESLEKDLLIAELKNRNKSLEMQIKALRALFDSASNIVSI